MKRFLAIAAVLALVSFIVLGVAFAQAKFMLRVNAGDSASYTDKAGNVWKGDKEYTKGGGYGFVGGDTVDRGSSMKIEGTNDPKIYQTERYSMDRFVAEVPNGKYTVRLHFAETYDGIDTDGPRVFDVKIQGAVVLKDLDVAKTAGKVQKALIKEFKGVAVTNGTLDITFVAKQQNPEINGIEIIAE
jgi:hypothetical protein